MTTPAELLVGTVARWPSAPGSPLGVVVQHDGLRVHVRFDGSDEPKVFNARAGVVERVELTGIMVRRVSTGSIGLVQAMATTTPPRWQVIFDGRLVIVAEADLRPHVLDDPRGRILKGRLGSARQFSLAVTARRYEIEQLTNDLVCLGESRVDIKPHQVSVVHRVISNYPHRFLLCDEVGLGKTIKAGMILKELRARGAAGRCLVIVPVLVENSVTGSGLDFHAAGRYSFSSPPRPCRRRILSIRAGNGIMFGSSLGARRSIPSPWWLRPAL